MHRPEIKVHCGMCICGLFVTTSSDIRAHCMVTKINTNWCQACLERLKQKFKIPLSYSND